MSCIFHYVVSSSDGLGRRVIVECYAGRQQFFSLDEILEFENLAGISKYRQRQIRRFFEDGVIPYADVRILACV